MKRTKVILSIALALIIGMIAVLPAFAVETGKITVTGVTAGQTYNIYRVFDMTAIKNGDVVNASYTINPVWNDFFTGTGAGAAYISDTNIGNALNPITIGSSTKYINITEANIANFAAAAQEFAIPLAPTATQTAAEGATSLVFDGLALGYYLVYPYGATQVKEGEASLCSLDSTTFEVSIKAKSTYPTITKTVNSEGSGSFNVGDTVNFTINGTVPNTAGYTSYIYEISDTMTSGLEFNEVISVKVGDTVLNPFPAEDYTLIKNADNKAIGFKFKLSGVKTYTVGDPIVVTYSATITSDALVTNEQTNSASLRYSNDPNNIDETYTTTTPPTVVEIYTGTVRVKKVDGDGNPLTGAIFALKNSEGKYYKFDGDKVTWVDNRDDATTKTTAIEQDENNQDIAIAEFAGVSDGTYSLEEVQAPDGYNPLNGDVTGITVNSKGNGQNDIVVKEVENRSGSLLPGTGGIGTTIFYIVGAILLLGAGILLISKRRMSTKVSD
ncbi:MAG: SpaH/EbpB family LPXTG-anchored major pilin [Clostridia bacterium]|nr:SpaH/EbpB family LPXTG-anchored major pilin [Clostridia bacterium]